MLEDILVEFFASFFIWFLFAGLLVLWVIDGKIKREQVIHALFACLIAFLASLIIKHFFPTIRPFVRNGGEVDVLIRPVTGAFPSEHAAIAFALSVTVFMHDRRVGWWFLASALIIGIARVVANVHYPVDIIGGAFLGTIVAIIIEKFHFSDLVNKFSPRRKR